MPVTALIMAGGKGERLSVDIPKQFLLLKNKPILALTIDIFEKHDLVDDIYIVAPHNHIETVYKEIIEKYSFNKIKKVVCGGKTRQESVYNGLLALSDKTEKVLIHDGVRPFVTKEKITEIIEATDKFSCCALGVKVKDTIKVCDDSGKILSTPNRNFLWHMQTPQSFLYKTILNAYKYINENGFNVTDDCQVCELYGENVYIVTGDYNNIKITTKEDLDISNCIMEKFYEKN